MQLSRADIDDYLLRTRATAITRQMTVVPYNANAKVKEQPVAIERGGKTVFGANVGILMLETQFPRVVGDMGNALTWPFPVQYRVVRGATPHLVVRNDATQLTDLFIVAAKDLVASGADGITTNCGFLALIQGELAQAVGVPVATSSLMQVPWIQSMLPPGKRVGILTISKDTLTDKHLTAANIPLDIPIGGTDAASEFASGILNDRAELDFDQCHQDNLTAASQLMKQHTDIGAIVLECTNMVPYASAIRKLTGVPVYSIYSFVTWFQAGLMPRRFSMDLNDPI